MAVVVVWSLVVAVASMVFGAAPASAHTGFESSTPADQSTVEEAVELVTISFTGEATPVGDGFVALNARGELQAPVSVSTLDDQMFTMRFDPPLAGGQVGIRWNVKAADAHPIEGAFSFTVTAPLPTTAPPSTVPAATTPATTEGSELPASSEIPASSAAPVPSEVAAEETETTDVAVAVGGDVTASGDGSAASAPSLDEFLAVDDSGPGETLSLIGRILGLVGVALALGAVAFGFTALRGPRFELRTFLAATAGVSGVLVVGALVEYVGVVRLGDESIGSAWSSSPGFATVLRVAGGIALVIGLVVTMRRDEFSMVRAPRGLSAAAAVEDLTTLDAPARADERVRWVPTRYAWPIGVGVVLVLVSFWFDGHTVSKGVRPLHALVNTVHVAAGSIWVGGVVSLCAVAWARHRRGTRGRRRRVGRAVLAGGDGGTGRRRARRRGHGLHRARLVRRRDRNGVGPDAVAQVRRRGGRRCDRGVQPLPTRAGARCRARICGARIARCARPSPPRPSSSSSW